MIQKVDFCFSTTFLNFVSVCTLHRMISSSLNAAFEFLAYLNLNLMPFNKDSYNKIDYNKIVTTSYNNTSQKIMCFNLC